MAVLTLREVVSGPGVRRSGSPVSDAAGEGYRDAAVMEVSVRGDGTPVYCVGGTLGYAT